MTNQFNIQTTQKKVLYVTEETVVQLSTLDLGNILREKFSLPDAEVLWDTQGGFPVCKLISVKKTEEVQDVLQDVPSAQEDVDPNDPSTWKVGDLIECNRTSRGYFTEGRLYEFKDYHWDSDQGKDYLIVMVAEDDYGNTNNGWHIDNFKWRCRPTKLKSLVT